MGASGAPHPKLIRINVISIFPAQEAVKLLEVKLESLKNLCGYAAFSFDIDGNFHSSKEGVHARSNVRMSDKKKRRKYKK